LKNTNDDFIEVKTTGGTTYRINKDCSDDMELLDALIDMENGDLSAMKTVIKIVLGDEGKKALYEANRKENGRVSADGVMNELREIMELMPQTVKNS